MAKTNSHRKKRKPQRKSKTTRHANRIKAN
eukprot:COSAG01_NODE_69_length_28801_cov_10.460038_27_plen_29_part_01